VTQGLWALGNTAGGGPCVTQGLWALGNTAGGGPCVTQGLWVWSIGKQRIVNQ
jgi:hypothetical protein